MKTKFNKISQNHATFHILFTP